MSSSYFDRLLKRYLSGSASSKEKESLEKWLDLNKTGIPADERLSPDEEDLLLQKIMSRSSRPLQTESLTREMPRKTSPWWWAAAACFVILIASLATWQLRQPLHHSQEVVASNVPQKEILADGSLVWLQPGSQLEYETRLVSGQQVRYAILAGEALFEVAKDPNRPFIVECGEVKLRVVGTSFHVKAAGKSVALKVLTGRVNLSAPARNMNLEISANEQVLVTATTAVEKLQLSAEEKASVTAGLEYNMQFQNGSLKEVAEALATKFDRKLVLGSETIGSCQLTIDLTDMSLESSLQMISEILNVTYSQRFNTITLSGNACH